MKEKRKAWVISVDMGYGHQRAAYPLRNIAYDRIITANSDKIVTKKEKKLWGRTKTFYDWVSRMAGMPIIGDFLYGVYNKIQKITSFYPFRDLSRPDVTTRIIYRLIKRKNLGKSIVEHIKTANPKIPIISTHPVASLIAEYHGLKRNYCVVTDTDIARAWVPLKPKESKIIYLAPTTHTAKRLELYGVPKKKIIMTGFPLPHENLGGNDLRVLKNDLWERLPNLDPKGAFQKRFRATILKTLGKSSLRNRADHKLTLTFPIAGEGAQKKIAVNILKSLKSRILNKKIIVNIITGIRFEVTSFIEKKIKEIGLEEEIGKGVRIISETNKKDYFELFNKVMRKTDILWTKPSELSFYVGLGIPILIAPPIGAHEVFNREWLEHHRFGIRQEETRYCNEWLFRWIEDGRFAEIAWKGFIEAPNRGVYRIEREVFRK